MNKELSILLDNGTSTTLKKKDFIIEQGQISDKVYFIIEGVVRHYVITPDGKEKTIRLSKENNFFYSSIVSYFKKKPSYIYCQCLTDCKMVCWSSDHLNELFKNHPKLAEFRNNQLINFILEKHDKEVALLTKNSEERYQEFCKHNMALFNRIPHHIIASFLDITPETLSRLRAKKS